MALPGALLALFLAGSWLYCLTDAALTPAPECRGLPKPAWLAVIAVTLSAGALAWLIVRHRTYRRSAPRRAAGGRGEDAQGARRRPGVHPGARPGHPAQPAGRLRPPVS